ncbi:MAG: cytidine(C)-cytidine(C)-adenosine (A)]-adding enzyme [bacterium]|nr:MAG: cytidine(C)-cytidine(C)-adenosine (A)]-adding enzyme [bacterium]
MDDTVIVTKRILDDRLNQLVFNEIPGAYLVGGFIRDAFLSRISGDRDFAVKGEPDKVAFKIKGYVGGTIVKLKDGSTVRIALKDGTTLDFSRYEGEISDDLLRRDFTINAIAFSVETGLYDPAGGIADLKTGCIRMTREENLRDDPVRLIRAYRFVGEIDGHIDDNTREVIRRHKGLLRQSAPERITLEFFKLLQSKACVRALREAFEDNLGCEIIPIKNNKLDDIMQKLIEVTRKLKEAPEEFKEDLDAEVSQGLTLKGLVLLDILLEETGMENTQLRLSKKLKTRIARFKNRQKGILSSRDASDEALYDCLEGLGDSILEVILIEGREDLYAKAKRYLTISGNPVLDGEDIAEITGVGEGPAVGRLLYEVKKAQFAGKISDSKDAADYLKRFCGKKGA